LVVLDDSLPVSHWLFRRTASVFTLFSLLLLQPTVPHVYLPRGLFQVILFLPILCFLAHFQGPFSSNLRPLRCGLLIVRSRPSPGVFFTLIASYFPQGYSSIFFLLLSPPGLGSSPTVFILFSDLVNSTLRLPQVAFLSIQSLFRGFPLSPEIVFILSDWTASHYKARGT